MKRSFVGGLFSGFAMLALVLVVAQAVSAGSSLSAAQVAARSQAAEVSAAALGTDFLYQGQLKQSGTPPTTSCSMAFRLFDAASSGNQIGSPITTTVPVTQGLFTVSLDFGGSAFNGEARWLGIKVKCGSDPSFTDLDPRQPLAVAPYALYSLNSQSANALQGNPVSNAAPATGAVLQWNGSQWTAATLSRARKYYQTSATFAANQALTACAAGYHMANFAEIFNTSSLEYATSQPGAALGQDSGSGPPFSITGWVRTGVGSGINNQVGGGNCLSWTTNLSTSHGTTVALNPDWLGAATNMSPWGGLPSTCNSSRRVWCIEN